MVEFQIPACPQRKTKTAEHSTHADVTRDFLRLGDCSLFQVDVNGEDTHPVFGLLKKEKTSLMMEMVKW